MIRGSCLFRRVPAPLATLCLTTYAFAGTTGKISGVVTDDDLTPLPGVAVTVHGTRLGATTDADGR